MKVPGDAQRVGCMERRASEILGNRPACGGGFAGQRNACKAKAHSQDNDRQQDLTKSFSHRLF